MRLVDTLLVVIALAGLAGIGWWGAAELPRAAERLQTGLQIAAQDELQRAGLGWAQVTMDGQAATIYGTQPNSEIVDEAVRTVLTSSGNGGLIYGGITSINTVIDAPPIISPFTWSFARDADGVATLGGFVPNDDVRADLVARAEAISSTLVDDLQLASGLPAGGWQSIAELGLNLVGALDAGAARLSDTRLTVRGRAVEPAVRARVRSDLAGLPEPYRGEADIQGPGRWSARHFRGDLILAGLVGSEAEREDLLDLAAEHFDGGIVDEMTVADADYDSWLIGPQIGLPQFADFLSGEFAFDPAGDGYRFEGTAARSTLNYLSEDLEDLDSPYAVILSATPVDAEIDTLVNVDFDGDPLLACETALAAMIDARPVVFEPGAATISRESGLTLDRLVAVASRCSSAVSLELGVHTDNDGDRSANLRLSRQRAQAVADYMISAGFDGDRLTTVGYGPDEPVADNTTPEGRAANRRLQFKVMERSE